MPAFVKFSRGLISTYNRLTNKDPDTLYLVYETKDATSGFLYLGDKLIGSVGGDSTILSLSQLSDVNLNNQIEDGMVLQYNGSTGGGQWQAARISGNNISISDSLNNITNPSEKSLAIIGTDVYVYHNNSWMQLSNSSLLNRIISLETKVGEKGDDNSSSTGLYKEIEDFKKDVYTKQEIDNLQHLKYQIVESVDDIDLNDSPANIIYLVPKSLEDGYIEYSVINGKLEPIGESNIDLSNYVTTDDTRLLTEIQQKKVDSLGFNQQSQVATINAAQVVDLNTVIQNNQFIKSVSQNAFQVTPEGELQLIATPGVDLSDYVKVEIFNSTIGDLDSIINRQDNSTLVQEINSIKQSLIWQEINNN